MPIKFIDRLGFDQPLEPAQGALRNTLLANSIPPCSVLITKNDRVVSEYDQYNAQNDYIISLIEGYDIGSIRAILEKLNQPLPDEPNTTVLVKRNLLFGKDTKLIPEATPLDEAGVVDYLENRVLETVKEFDLFSKDSRVVIGLSGGVDSSALALVLSRLRSVIDYELVAATFEDYDSKTSPTYVHATKLAEELQLEHHIVPSSLIEDLFGLNQPLRTVLPALMETEDAAATMYVDHHTTRRALEAFTATNGASCIALGLHTTDLLAGLLNGISTGYTVGSLPKREIGDISYVYPLAFIQKRELHLYHYAIFGQLVKHSFPNPWEQLPLDRNYYYYLADMLQEHWPGLETQLFPSHNWRMRREIVTTQSSCSNCGSTLINQPFMPVNSDECEVCVLFKKYGFRRN